MKISCTNVFGAAGSLSVTNDDNTAQDIDHILTPTFDQAYTSNGSSTTFTIYKTFTSAEDIEYVAIAGHNFSDLANAAPNLTIEVNGVEKADIDFSSDDESNWIIMVHFDSVSASNIQIELTKDSADAATISYVAAGELLDTAFTFASNNERGGYPKAWAAPNREYEVAKTWGGLPVSMLTRTVTQRIRLNIPDVARSVITSAAWKNFCALCGPNGDGSFFIKEDDGDTTGVADDPMSSYLCIMPMINQPKTNRKTRALVDLGISFEAVNGYNS